MGSVPRFVLRLFLETATRRSDLWTLTCLTSPSRAAIQIPCGPELIGSRGVGIWQCTPVTWAGPGPSLALQLTTLARLEAASKAGIPAQKLLVQELFQDAELGDPSDIEGDARVRRFLHAICRSGPPAPLVGCSCDRGRRRGICALGLLGLGHIDGFSSAHTFSLARYRDNRVISPRRWSLTNVSCARTSRASRRNWLPVSRGLSVRNLRGGGQGIPRGL